MVQQLQEGLVDFMCSGTAIWGSVAPKLQVFDFPFLWRDWEHVHGVVDGPVGRAAADYMEAAVGVRPLAWGDSFGFRQVVTRSRDVSEPGQLAGLKIRTIQSPIYVKAVELMGASPTPMAFGEVYTSLQTGVIDGYEHDASTTLQQRFFEVARHMARTRHIAGVLGLWASARGTRAAAPRPASQARGGGARGRASPARAGRAGGPHGDREPRGSGHDDPRHRPRRLPRPGRDALARRGTGPRRRSVAQGRARVTRALEAATALLVAALAAAVGLQVVGRHLFHTPLPWTEEIARLLLVWLMCIGGIRALQDVEHPRVTALVRRLRPERRAAVERGLQLVLLVFFLCLAVPAWRLTLSSAGERLPASGLSGAWMSVMLPVGLLAMVGVLLQKLREESRAGLPLAWTLGAAALVIASVALPLVVGAPPLAVLVSGFLVTAALGLPLAFTLALTSATYLVGIGGVSLTILPIKLLGGVDSFVLLAIPLFILAGALMESGTISERIVDLAMALVGRVRGGLAMVVVVAEVIFSGISGSTAADVSAISSLLVPSMRKAGYSAGEAVSVVSAASAMGILVPPCLTMVVLGSLVNLSIVTLFLAGFLPAFLLAALLLALIAVRARRQGWPVAEPASKGDLARAARRAIVPLGLPALLFGGIFSGITTVTEAALVAVVYALAVGLATGGIGRVNLVRLFERSGVVTAMTLWVLAAASAFAWILVREWVPQSLALWISGVGAGRALFLALTVFVFVVIGALLEGLPALLIFGPMLFPIGRAVGVDPVHYGIVIVAAMGIAFFLPPVGVGLSIASSIARVDVDEVSRSYLPYLAVLLTGLALIAAWPGLTLVLPRVLLGYRG